jgi:hypothetical protein
MDEELEARLKQAVNEIAVKVGTRPVGHCQLVFCDSVGEGTRRGVAEANDTRARSLCSGRF